VRDVLLFAVGLLAGALNSVAGGGSFLTLPTLLLAGVSPVSANATSTFAIWPGSIASVIAYRRDIRWSRAGVPWLVGISLLGGGIGATLLVRTSDESFMRLLPWLMLVAASTFTFGGRRTLLTAEALTPKADWHSPRWFLVAAAMQLAIASYGGYFGGGAGIMMLASLAAAGMHDIHEMNGLKALLGVSINGVALAAFALSGVIAWKPGVLMMAGAITGGYGGARLARRVDRRYIVALVVIAGWTMTIYFFLR
jgi:uncharacterized membrane protein YfcA